MSKRSLFWGNASGKLGEAVYYRAGGEQRTRAWVPTIKNPRTLKQATQRCKLNNITAVYRAVPTFIKSVFQPAKTSRSAFNQFTSDNMYSPAFMADKDMITAGVGVPYGFSMSSGNYSAPTGGELDEGSSVLKSSTDMQGVRIEGAPVPEIALVCTGATVERAGLIYGSEFYADFQGIQNNSLPSEFYFFILRALYVDTGWAIGVYSVKCSQASTDKLHLVESSPKFDAATDAANINYLAIPVTGTLQAGDTSNPAKLQNTTQLIVGGLGSIDTQSFAACCIAWRDDMGIHSSPSRFVGQEPAITLANDWLAAGDVGVQILDKYYTPSNSLV